MPVIVYKTMTIELFYAQGRRINCECCRQPFCYITGGVSSAQTTGIPLVSSDDNMRRTALNQAIRSLRKIAKKANIGEALCPHCHSYQGWMVTKSLLTNLGCFSVLGLVVLGGAAALLNFLFEWSDNYLLVVGGSVVAGAVLGLILGKLVSITGGPHPEKEDGRSMTDEQFREFIQQCDQHDADPFLAWWITLGNQPGEKQAVVSVGLEDCTYQPVFPAALSTDQVLASVG